MRPERSILARIIHERPVSWRERDSSRTINHRESRSGRGALENDAARDPRGQPSDLAYNYLQIWIDGNHDGVSQPGELWSLRELGVSAVSVVARQDERRDPVGN